MSNTDIPVNVTRALEGILLLPGYEQAAMRVIASPKMGIPPTVTNHKELMEYAKETMGTIPLISPNYYKQFKHETSEEEWLSRAESIVTYPMFRKSYRRLFMNGISEEALYEMFLTMPKGTTVGKYMLIGLSRVNRPKDPDAISWATRNEEVQVWRNIEDATPLIF